MFATRRVFVCMAVVALLMVAAGATAASKSSKSRSTRSSSSASRSTRSTTTADRTDKTSQDKAEAARKGVRASLEEFYVALSDVYKGRMSPIADIWMHTPDVTLMGPFGGRQTGWDNIKAEYDRESKLKLSGHIEPKDVVIQVTGDVACVVCTESGLNFAADGKPVEMEYRATNIFRRDRDGGGKWKLIHHQTDLSPNLQTAAGYVPKTQPAGRRSLASE